MPCPKTHISDDCTWSRAPKLRARLAANFEGWQHDNAIFEREIEKVIAALRTGGKPPPPQPKLGRSP